MTRADIPVTGAWREGDPVGRRQFQTLFESRAHVLEACGRLDHVTVAYETWGELDAARDTAVLVPPGLPGNTQPPGPAGPGHPEAGWWDAIVGRGKAVDTDRF